VTHIANTASALRPTNCQTMTNAKLSIKHKKEQHIKFRLFQFHTFCWLSSNFPTLRGNYRSAPFLKRKSLHLSTFNAENKMMFKACSVNKNDYLYKQVYSLRDVKARTPITSLLKTHRLTTVGCACLKLIRRHFRRWLFCKSHIPYVSHLSHDISIAVGKVYCRNVAR